MFTPSLNNEKEAADSLSEALLPHGVAFEGNFRSGEVNSSLARPLLG